MGHRGEGNSRQFPHPVYVASGYFPWRGQWTTAGPSTLAGKNCDWGCGEGLLLAGKPAAYSEDALPAKVLSNTA